MTSMEGLRTCAIYKKKMLQTCFYFCAPFDKIFYLTAPVKLQSTPRELAYRTGEGCYRSDCLDGGQEYPDSDPVISNVAGINC
ncbi:hypothetical protein J4Q44_G00331370 [Coregonus suidteri]|uniref:Uncharacterized protein n=1 Tax=Coregonus suidteri TaxID=861788 RepID=A0AAN8L3P0_9TELE